jgi:hypothetical protein
MFAPIGVLSNAERHAINAAQVKRFAEQHGLPVLRWRRQLFRYGPKKSLKAGNSMPADKKNQLYDSDPGMWAYFVPGAPMMCTEIVNTARKIANGTICVARSLSFDTAELQAHVAALAAAAQPGEVIDLADRPLSVNVEVTMPTAAEAAAWPADAMFPRTPGQDACAVVIPILVSNKDPTSTEMYSVPAIKAGVRTVYFKDHKVRLESYYPRADPRPYVERLCRCSISMSYLEGLPLLSQLHPPLPPLSPIRLHPLAAIKQVELMFAVTDYKLQGQTLDKLILSLGERTFKPHLSLQKLYVLVSRVRAAKDIRLLKPQDPNGFNYIKHLQHVPALHVWNSGYNASRSWEDNLANAAWTEYQDRDNSNRTSGKKRKAPQGRFF